MTQSGKFTVAGSVFRPMTNGTANRPKHFFPPMYLAVTVALGGGLEGA